MEAEEFDGETGAAVEGKLGEHLADGAGAFEAVAAETAGEEDVLVSGVAVDDELEVGAVGVHADAHG